VYVHYDDAQFSKGSFTNRVQIKTTKGSQWLTVPLRDLRLGQKIMDVIVDDRQDWRRKHLAFLEQAYDAAPHRDDMLSLVEGVYKLAASTISEVAIASSDAIRAYFGFANPTEVLWSSALGVEGESSRRVLDIVKHCGGTTYVTGHGARNYLDHELFEREGVRVEYIDYKKLPYPQLHGDFTPFVSALDVVANVGRDGKRLFSSGTVYWKQFIA
jgi:hypothetical protein